MKVCLAPATGKAAASSESQMPIPVAADIAAPSAVASCGPRCTSQPIASAIHCRRESLPAPLPPVLITYTGRHASDGERNGRARSRAHSVGGGTWAEPDDARRSCQAAVEPARHHAASSNAVTRAPGSGRCSTICDATPPGNPRPMGSRSRGALKRALRAAGRGKLALAQPDPGSR